MKCTLRKSICEICAIENNSGLQIVPDWRLRLGAVWRFRVLVIRRQP